MGEVNQVRSFLSVEEEEEGNAAFRVNENIPSELKELLPGSVFLLNEGL
jgi:hypothetical protein